ncbi:MAG: hypothetical protein QW098_00700 [Candidatus Hadarchaeales archaeon]
MDPEAGGDTEGACGEDKEGREEVLENRGEGKEFLLYLDSVRFICEEGLLPKLRKLDVRVSASLAIGAAVCLLPETD